MNKSEIEIIKDKSNKKIKIKCKYCCSILKIPRKEFKRGFGGTRWFTCPVCNNEDCRYESIFGWF